MATAESNVNPTVNKNPTEDVNANHDSAAKKRGRAGAPRGNFNGMRHGLKASKLPPKCKGEEREIYFLRQEIFAELVTIHGSPDAIPLLSLALLQSLVRHEQRCRLAARWLRLQGDSLPLAERLSLLDTISKATDARDRCLERAGLTTDAISRRADDDASVPDVRGHADIQPLVFDQPSPPATTQPLATAEPQPPT